MNTATKKEKIFFSEKNIVIIEEIKGNLAMLGSPSKYKTNPRLGMHSDKSSSSTLDTTFKTTDIGSREHKKSKISSTSGVFNTKTNKTSKISLHKPSLKKDRSPIESKLTKPTESWKNKMSSRSHIKKKGYHTNSSVSKNQLGKRKLQLLKYQNKYIPKTPVCANSRKKLFNNTTNTKANLSKNSFKLSRPKKSMSPMKTSINLCGKEVLSNKLIQIKEIFDKFRTRAESESRIHKNLKTIEEASPQPQTNSKYLLLGLGMLKSTLCLAVKRELRDCFIDLKSSDS
ncbi:unnamed protein product [Moneuplotes crassus]|uniref:Uncharacterized protein n=1 Tax=Euplotes crassus TaxID=5936 RepID=A0AAD1XBB9_EUPCR|nr:unnamed protein product [Moneuplotes crassus]